MLPGPLQAGIAGTSFAAFVAAGTRAGGRHRRSSSRPATTRRFLAPYPARLLTRDPDVRARLARFGLRTIGSVAELPRIGRWWPASGTRERGCTPGPAARRPSGSGRGGPPSGSRSRCRSTRPRRGSTPCGSSSAGSSATLADQLQARGQAAGLARLDRDPRPRVRPARRSRPASTSSSASPSRPRTPRRSSACCSPASRRRRRRPPSRAWSSSSRGSRRRPVSSCRCSRRRPPAMPAWPGSSRGWRSRSGRTACGGSSSPIPRRRSPRRAGAGCRSREPR